MKKILVTGFVLFILIFLLMFPAQSSALLTGSIAGINKLFPSVDETADPCDNFYQYACGKWDSKHPPETDVMASSTILQMKNVNMDKILNFLKQENAAEEPSCVHDARQIFSLCNDTEHLDQIGLQPLRKLFELIGISAYPTLKEPSPNFDLGKSIILMKKHLGINMFFDITVMADLRNSSRNVLTVWPASYALLTEKESSTYSRSKIREDKSNFISDVLKVFCADSTEGLCNRSSLEKIVENGFLLSYYRKYRMNWSYLEFLPIPDNPIFVNLTTLEKETEQLMQKRGFEHPLTNWTKMFALLLENVVHDTVDLTKPDNVTIQISLKELHMIIYFLHYHPPAYHEFFMWLTIVEEFAQFVSDPLRSLKQKHFADIFGNKTRENWCAETVSKYLKMPIAYYYMTNPNYNENRNQIEKMVEDIRRVFEEEIKQIEWMDGNTKLEALKKIRKLKKEVGFPENVRNGQDIELYMQTNYGVDVFSFDTFLPTILHLTQKDVESTLSTIDETNGEQVRLHLNPTEVNAFCFPDKNFIGIPAGISQRPLFENDFQALNYGGLGSVIGHELIHNFDVFGRKFDYEGNLRNWWSNETAKQFRLRAKCIEKFYTSYNITHKYTFTTNGHLSEGENIADNGGFKQALMAYRNYVKENGYETLPESLANYSAEKLFTMNFATIYCENPTKFTAEIERQSVHSPNEIRVNGVAINSEEFSEIWGCKPGTKMNPLMKKCNLW